MQAIFSHHLNVTRSPHYHRRLLKDPNALIDIIPFQPRHRQAFKRLNLEWLEKYFRVEPIDHIILSRPAAILRQGGAILLARHGMRLIGTCALLKDGHSRYELSKMAVTAAYQGSGIGRRLLMAAIHTYEAKDGTELFLETNSALNAAIHLYESVGFVHAPRPATPAHYTRADVYMVYRPNPRQRLAALNLNARGRR